MKDPAFLFYSADFLSGVQDLTMEERGQYITLLCLQHIKGKLTDKIIQLSVGNAAADVMAKFRHVDGIYYSNARLDEEIQKRKEYTEKQRKRAVEGWQKRKNSATAQTMADAAALPLENVNVNENIDNNKEPKQKKFIPPTLPEVIEYFKENGYSSDAAKKAFNYYQAGDWKGSDGKQVRNWKQKMIAVWFKPEYYVNGIAPETKKDKTPIAL